MKRINRILNSLLLLSGLILTCANLSAREVPQLTGRVNDYANMISPSAEQQLDQILSSLEQSDSTQITVLTIDSLEGDSLEEFSIRVADAWKIGQEKEDNGAILLISKNDRQIRIEVGYGLEGVLTDLAAGRIIDSVISPAFKNGDFDGGIINGVTAMAGMVQGEFTAKDFAPQKRSTRRRGFNPSSFFLIFVFFYLFNAIGGQRRGKKKKFGIRSVFSGILGAVIFPVLALLFLPFGFWIFLLIPGGFFLGTIMSLMSLTGGGRYHGGGFYGGGGGFSGGGFGGGGFSGGGGGFGGGGASGGW